MGVGEVVRVGSWVPGTQFPKDESASLPTLAAVHTPDFEAHRWQSVVRSPPVSVSLVLFPPSTPCLPFLNCFPHSTLLRSTTARGRVDFLGGSTFIPIQGRQGKQISQDLLCTKPGLRYPWVPLASKHCSRSTTTPLGEITQDKRGWGSCSSVGLPVPLLLPLHCSGDRPGRPGPPSSWML